MAQAAPLNPVLGMFPFAALRDEIAASSPEQQQMQQQQQQQSSRPPTAPRAFVVDVGGGRGNALVDMLRECGGVVPGPMVLQDLPEVLEGRDPVRLEGVETMPYNFLDEQPVKSMFSFRAVKHCFPAPGAKVEEKEKVNNFLSTKFN